MPPDENREYARQKGRRIMARFALRRMSKLAAESREEDRRNAVFAKRVLLAIGVFLATVIVAVPALWLALPFDSRGELAVVSVVLALIGGLIAANWPSRR